MPPVHLLLYRTEEGRIPVLDWLGKLDTKARAKARIRLEMLSREGWDLRRPCADYLRDGIYELRFKHRGVNFRILYFFHQRDTAVIFHGFSKQAAKVPAREIDREAAGRLAFKAHPDRHTFKPGLEQ